MEVYGTLKEVSLDVEGNIYLIVKKQSKDDAQPLAKTIKQDLEGKEVVITLRPFLRRDKKK